MTEFRIGRPKVLVVDDEADLADVYARMLDEYDVETAYDGAGALDAVDESFDVVLLDRRMPEVGGDAVLAEIRRRNLDVRVAMVTAVEPDLDIIDMPFDDYLTKPVATAELRATVERLLLVESYEQTRVELSSKRVKRNVLEAEMSDEELATSEEFARLEEDIGRLESELARLESRIDEEYLTAPQPA